MHIYQDTVIFEPAEEGGYVVHVPALNGAATQGETLEEAREMAKDLIIGFWQASARFTSRGQGKAALAIPLDVEPDHFRGN